MQGQPGTVIMPSGSRRATITPTLAVSVSRSPPRQRSQSSGCGGSEIVEFDVVIEIPKGQRCLGRD
jgi:hypothetical protein